VPSIATHLEYMTGTPPANCGGGAGGGATDWLCSTDNYLMPGPDVPLDLGYVYKTDIYCSCASTGGKYAIMRSEDSLVLDQGYPMAEFKADFFSPCCLCLYIILFSLSLSLSLSLIGVDAASGLEKYAIIRSQDSLVVDQGYPMAEFKADFFLFSLARARARARSLSLPVSVSVSF